MSGMVNKKPKILLYDVESSFMKLELPSFELYGNDYINHKYIKEDPYIISIAWKFLGQKSVKSTSVIKFPKVFKNNPRADKEVLKEFSKVFNEADLIVAHNTKFDIRKLNARLIQNSLPPVKEVPTYDTLKVARKIAKFPSNRLDYLAQTLGYKGKTESEGLWHKIYNKGGNAPKEIKQMESYNRNDVDILEFVFNKLKAYGPDIAQLKLQHNIDGVSCAKCGSSNTVKNGSKMQSMGRYQLHRCNDCGGITKGSKIK